MGFVKYSNGKIDSIYKNKKEGQEDFKEKILEKTKVNEGETIKCVICNKQFIVGKDLSKFCSNKCFELHIFTSI